MDATPTPGTSPTASSQVPPDTQSSEAGIKCLCNKLRNSNKSGYIGYLNNNQYKHYIEVIPSNALAEDISLADVLSQQESDGLKLGLRERYELAVTLATSVLQLHTTPWLDEHWSNKDVYFVRKRAGSSPASSAYIQKSFAPQKVRTMSDPAPVPVENRPPVRNETIFALGVSLIELSLGKPLASFRKDEDLGPDGQHSLITDWIIANRLLKEKIALNEGDRYSKTVHRCINCIFDPLDPSLENEAFRQAFYENAVVPLKEVLVDFIK